ncbi:MAG TPA: DUF4129 domain-containing protein [Verrucomicrobiae bacterium]|jgi:uncharacterized membrane protein|nr:DUF4129 domain-containing protein [Verrucomicrobiae bacterium]
MKNQRRQQGHRALDLIEEAVHLLRTTPTATLAVYYLGTMPFVLGLLFFWADMSRNPFAPGRLADASLAMGLLFLWMKFWQTIFARRIRAQRAAQAAPPLGFRQGVRILMTQMIWQPFGLFLIPISLFTVLPFAWVYAFYQNLTTLDNGNTSPGQVFKKSWRQAGLWPGQNNIAILIFLGFAVFVFLNWAIFCLALPDLCKTLLGIESKFTQSPRSLLNTTFFAGMFGLTYLCVDPILKTFYTLRCFYGESAESGEDLKAELKEFALAISKVAAALVLVSTIVFSMPAFAADSPAKAAGAPAASPVSPTQLDGALNQTIHERKYIWRMPREKFDDANASEGPFGRFLDKVWDMIHRWSGAILHWIAKAFHGVFSLLEKLLEDLFGGRRSYGSGSSGTGWITSVHVLLWALVAVVVAVLAILFYRVWRGRRKTRSVVASEAILPVPDVADENTAADELPEEEWIKLGRELLARGELRLAMRAFYLASLSLLASRNLITIARFKSNREYERELRRRGHSFPDLLTTFGQNISAFEASWYGSHEVNQDSVNQFALNVEKIKSAG